MWLQGCRWVVLLSFFVFHSKKLNITSVIHRYFPETFFHILMSNYEQVEMTGPLYLNEWYWHLSINTICHYRSRVYQDRLISRYFLPQFSRKWSQSPAEDRAAVSYCKQWCFFPSAVPALGAIGWLVGFHPDMSLGRRSLHKGGGDNRGEGSESWWDQNDLYYD